ncbi:MULTISPECIES: tripartite tricarboxylate transporter TctB family protein [Rhodomicrobium]|uniref:tripartite tricarboxylate transporter TctB family protein n=1 Tax=Rhodomicrobium TaxID=1068 RepID=UPI000B4C0749|nr:MULTISPECIES: tripartite tricarboxylate transporter TctB family protein [Rhodomicrobium]
MASDNDIPEAATPAVISRRTAEIAVSLILIALGILLAWDNWRVGARWAADGPQTGFFPFRLALILIAASLWGLFVSVRAAAQEGGAFVERAQFKRVLQVLVPMVIYVVSISYLGIYVPSGLLVIGFMRYLGGSSWLSACLTGIIFAALVFVLFDIEFRVLLPKGPIEAYFGF